MDSQNAITESFMNKCEKRQFIYDRLKEQWNFPKYSCPDRHGNKYYFFKNTGLQNQRLYFCNIKKNMYCRFYKNNNFF